MIFDAQHSFRIALFRIAFALSATMMLGAAPAAAQRAPASQKAAPVTVPATAPHPAPEPAAPEPSLANPAPANPAPVNPALVKPDNPGLLNELGKLFVKPADLFPGLKSSPDAAAPIVSPPEPGDVPVAPQPPPVIAAPVPPSPALPPTSPQPSIPAAKPMKPPVAGLVPQMIRGRSSCPLASNGAPDCKAGADKLCQDNGFAAGRSLDMDSAQTCSTKALLSGARTIKDICKTETFVTRAICQ